MNDISLFLWLAYDAVKFLSILGTFAKARSVGVGATKAGQIFIRVDDIIFGA